MGANYRQWNGPLFRALFYVKPRLMKYLIFLLLLSLTACQPKKGSTSVEEENINLASRYFNEVYNQDRIDLIDSLFTEEYEHTNTEGKVFQGRDELKKAVRRIESLLPNLQMEIEEVTADTEKVIFIIKMQSDLPTMASAKTQAEGTDFNETFVFWIKENKIHKGRSLGAHLPFIKQVSGFEGGLMDLIQVASEAIDTSGNQ